MLVIGGLTGCLSFIGKLGIGMKTLALAGLVLAFLPATVLANDPSTHQYASQLTQICVNGQIVTVEDTGGGGGAAGAGTVTGTCAEAGGGGGGGVASGGGGGTAEAPAAVGSLPFTGLDVALLAAVAAALLLTGLLLRRRRPGSAEA